MIAEYLTAISTSPWNNDHFYDFEPLETHDGYYDSKLTSRGTSRRTSECSEREFFSKDNGYSDYENIVVTSADSFLPDITLINSNQHEDFFYQGNDASNVSLSDLSDDDISSNNSSTDDESEDEDDEEMYPSPKKSKRALHDITWSEMSEEEHVKTIEQLITLISEEMNLRDQLEIIRIIKPNAEVSPTANEFTIELEWLTDEKLHKIRDYITQSSKNVNNTKLTNEGNEEEEHEKSSTKSTGKRRRSKRNGNERRQQMRAQRLRQMKENKQAVKEKKSGLFRNEKVLSVQRCQDDCKEVDILG